MTTSPSADADLRLEALYRDQSRELWALFYAYCGSAERAQDAVHEAFLRFQQQNTEEIREPRAWLLQVGRNWLRDQARRKANSVIKTDLLDVHPGTQEEPFAELLGNEQRDQIRAALQALKEEDRKALILRYALDWSSQKIGETLGSSAAAVDMRLSRARQRLAHELEQQGFQYD
jgi:RNA polymerase sigma-70 factor (ECF subfamily)